MTGEDKEFIRAREGIFSSIIVDTGLTGSATSPSLAFGDGNTGFFEVSDNRLRIAVAGTPYFEFQVGNFGSNGTKGANLVSDSATGTTPAFNFVDDSNTGIGSNASDQLSLIAGGTEGIRLQEAANRVIQVHRGTSLGLTADAGSSQGDGVITSTYNVYTTVATAGDAATLPSSFDTGMIIYVKNDAAVNSMDVFPASGDDAGAGTDTAVAVAAGDFAVFFATSASATWTKLMGGTA